MMSEIFLVGGREFGLVVFLSLKCSFTLVSSDWRRLLKYFASSVSTYHLVHRGEVLWLSEGYLWFENLVEVYGIVPLEVTLCLISDVLVVLPLGIPGYGFPGCLKSYAISCALVRVQFDQCFSSFFDCLVTFDSPLWMFVPSDRWDGCYCVSTSAFCSCGLSFFLFVS